jgi:AraC-like DNA-binding protein
VVVVRSSAPGNAVEPTHGPDGVVGKIEQLARMGLPSGQATLTGCASMLGMAPRTLQRHLEAAGTSFGQVINQVRAQELPRHFANRRLRLADIATMLGYASQSAFTRWHVDQFGITPRDARKIGLQRDLPAPRRRAR